MKKLYFLFVIFLFCKMSFSQISIERYGISSTGSFVNKGSIIAHSTVGTAVIPTFTKSSIIVTQGFEQPVSDSNVIDIFSGITDLPIKEKNIIIYPNPTSSYFTTQYSAQQKQELTIFNILGEAVYKDIYLPTQTQKTIIISDLPKGIYIIRIGSDSMKLLVE